MLDLSRLTLSVRGWRDQPAFRACRPDRFNLLILAIAAVFSIDFAGPPLAHSQSAVITSVNPVNRQGGATIQVSNIQTRQAICLNGRGLS
jgi:hypothetical protein